MILMIMMMVMMWWSQISYSFCELLVGFTLLWMRKWRVVRTLRLCQRGKGVRRGWKPVRQRQCVGHGGQILRTRLPLARSLWEFPEHVCRARLRLRSGSLREWSLQWRRQWQWVGTRRVPGFLEEKEELVRQSAHLSVNGWWQIWEEVSNV